MELMAVFIQVPEGYVAFVLSRGDGLSAQEVKVHGTALHTDP
jgi:hypothetical protein